MDRCEHILLENTLRNKDSILVIVSIPWHESNQDVSTKCQLTVEGSRTVCKNITLLYFLSQLYDGSLVITGILVCSLVLQNLVHIQNSVSYTIRLNANLIGCYEYNLTITLCLDKYTRVISTLCFHTSSNVRWLREQQGNSLTLHV